MSWVWLILVALLAAVVVGQVSYIRSTAGLKGSGLAVAIRAVNVALAIAAVGLAAWMAFRMFGWGGM